jgi:hypothetical protein
MRTALQWLHDALAAKDVAGMKYYRIAGGEIRATDGRITAGHPWPSADSFLVPGEEFEKVIKRMPGDITVTANEASTVTVKSSRFRGVISTLSIGEWNYPGVEDSQWLPLPDGLLPVLRALRPFISDNATQQWALCVALENGWAYATNNVALAGAPCPQLGAVQALLPCWAVDFVTSRPDHLDAWAWTDHYVAFRWRNGAWMRSQLVVGEFPSKAAALVRSALDEQPTQNIGPEFRSAFLEIAGLAEDTILVYADRIESTFGKAIILGEAECEVPQGAPASIWGAKYLAPIMDGATHWSPGAWPKPAVFKGPVVSGYVVGRRA